ncbi:MAG: 50S ribosomal protein L10 [candidate division SR1 bacterium CG_4_9_14_3_um_filter_40_9]|nr:MAG: 50S ribosomal protein L10 [candidate division SR1 bacterium CG_4_9_14_3_um_filter_40_9]
MAITKDKKKQLIKGYVEDLKSSNNIVIIQQKAVPVNAANRLRKDLSGTEGKFNVIRKRLFLIAVKEAGLDAIDIATLDGPVVAIFAKGDEFAPIKVVNKYLKEFKADDKGTSMTFLGGRFGKKRESAEYVSELANIPSKEELLSKLAYLFNYPLTSLACVLSEIAKKGGDVEIKGDREITKTEAKEGTINPQITTESPNPKA